MALSRRMLKAMGIDEEKIDEIIAAHSETVDALKDQRDSFKADAEKLPAVEKELADLKEAAGQNGGSAWEVKYNALKEEKEAVEKQFADFKAQTEAEKTTAAKDKAYRAMLKEIGISEKRIDAVMRVTDLSSVDLDEKGAIKEVAKVKDAAKNEWADFIVTNTETGAKVETPPQNTGAKKTIADIYAKDDHGRYIMSTAERQKAIADSLSQN